MADYTRIAGISGSDDDARVTAAVRERLMDPTDARTVAGNTPQVPHERDMGFMYPADDADADRWQLRVGQIVLHIERRVYVTNVSGPVTNDERFSIRCDDPLMTSTHFSETAPTYQAALEIARKLGKALNRVAQLQMIATEALNEAVVAARADLRACWGGEERF